MRSVNESEDQFSRAARSRLSTIGPDSLCAIPKRFPRQSKFTGERAEIFCPFQVKYASRPLPRLSLEHAREVELGAHARFALGVVLPQ